MRALPLLLLGLLLLGCAMSRSAAAVRIETLDDARALMTDRMRDRWDAAEDPEKTRWQEGLELIESLQRSAATEAADGDGEWVARMGDAFLEAVDTYADLLESGAGARERNAQLDQIRRLGDQLLGG